MNTIIYILDMGGHLQPVGVAGELIAGGLQVGRGYMNNIQLTSEKFIMPSATRNPFVKGFLDFPKLLFIHHSPLYRTGDLARWLPDPTTRGAYIIEFLGRIDHQVKIRGFRVELGEIENELVKHKDIKDAVVIPREDETGDKYLCVYYVPHHPGTVKVEELTAYLSRFLPGYMIPLHFFALDKIPLTASGKVDRKALPHPGHLEAGGAYVAPGNKIEEKLVELWSQVLGLSQEKIGIDNNFFHLGGQSLKAAMLISQIHSVFSVNLPLVEFFESPTIRAQGRYIKGAEVIHYTPIEPVEKKEYYVLSPAQKRLFIMHQMEAPYSVDSAWSIKGQLDKNRMGATVQQLIRRHESLRTSFLTVENEPVQKIHRNVDFKIEFYDFGGGDKGTGVSIEKILEDFVKPFDLSYSPLLRTRLIKTGEYEYIFIMDIHHIVSDGLSLGIFMREFMTLYQGRSLPALRVQYKDYCQWLKLERQQVSLEKQEEYWLKVFEVEVPVLELPYDYPRPAFQGFDGRRVCFQLEQEETGALKRFVSGESSSPTLYMVLLSLFNILLAKLSGNEDIVVGTPVHGRKHMDLQPIIGMFVGTLAMRFYPVPDKTIEHFIQEVKEHSLAALENQDYPFEELVEKVLVNRDSGRNPLFDVMFALEDSEIYPGFELEGLSVKPYERESGTVHFDIFCQVSEGADTLTFSLNYCTKLFKEETLKRFSTYFKKIISAAIKNPQGKLGEIEIITGEEKREILCGFNDTQVDYPWDKTISRLFEEQVERAPDQIAVVGATLSVGLAGLVSLSYRELNENAGRLARALNEKGILAEDVVGIMMRPSVEIPIGILAIFKSGGAYLPMDPDYPQERVDYMLKDSGAKLLVATNNIEGEKVGRWEGEKVLLEEISQSLKSSSYPLNLPSYLLKSSNLAYIIYTSGTTGKPKGALIDNKNLVNYVQWFREATGLTGKDRTVLTSSFCFDLGYTVIYPSILSGCQFHVIPKELYMSPGDLLAYIVRHGITFLKMTPLLFSAIAASEEFKRENCGELRLLVLGGEKIRTDDLNKAHKIGPQIKIMNHYGPTETTIGCIAQAIDFEKFEEFEKRPTIGHPIANVKIYIMDKTLAPTPVGVPGELCVSGVGVGRGYLNRPELTAEKFNRFYKSYRTNILYRTGDLVRLLPDGNVEFMDRIDQQVKIRGFRVELGEIENALIKHLDIKESVVIPLEDKTGDKYLCAYCVPCHQNIPKREELTAYLSQFLPGYMIPLYFLAIDKIPLNANGKVDRKALPRPSPMDTCSTYTAPRNKMEEKLVELWARVLGVDQDKIGIDHNFFHLGGQSLKLFMLTAMVHKEFDVNAPMSKFFEISSIRAQAQYINAAASDKYNAIEPVEKKDYYPMAPAQERMYVLHEMNPGGINYNMPLFMTVEGILEKTRLENSFRELIQRHESLRTSFHLVDNRLVQRIQDKVNFKIENYEERETEKVEILKNFVRSFDLSQAPFLRVGLMKTGEENHMLLVDMHHSISDGRSLEIFLAEILALYRGEKLPQLRIQYKDFSEWLQKPVVSDELAKQEEYWLTRLEGDLPVLKLPTDYPRPKEKNFAGALINFEISRDTAEKLRMMAKREDVTMFMVILTLFNILLFKLCHQEDIIVGTLVAGRRRLELDYIIGMFVNTLVLRNFPGGHKIFKEFLKEVKKTTLESFDHQDYPFDDLVERLGQKIDATRNPLFDVLFLFNSISQNKENKMEIPGLKMKPLREECFQAKFDLLFTGRDTGRNENLFFSIEYSTELFKKEKIERFISYFKEIILAIEKDESGALKDIGITHDLVVANSDFYRGKECDFEF